MRLLIVIPPCFGPDTVGLDHELLRMVRARREEPDRLDIIACPDGTRHLLDTLGPIEARIRHPVAEGDPQFLGFACHGLLRDNRGRYGYYGHVEDDIVVTDPIFFAKRRAFDCRFGPDALLQPTRYETDPAGPMCGLYVDWRLAERVTVPYQDLREQPELALPFADETILYERTPYPSAGCFFLDDTQLAAWAGGDDFLDRDVSYPSPLDSAVTLSVMKQFRIYKPVPAQAAFLEVMHASPRWIGAMDKDVGARAISKTYGERLHEK